MNPQLSQRVTLADRLHLFLQLYRTLEETFD